MHKNAHKNVSTASTSSFCKVPTGRSFVEWLGRMSGKRGFVKWLAAEIGLTPRQLANLARSGRISGIERAPNRYHFNWNAADPTQLAAWIRSRRRFRKGNRKRPKREKDPSELERLEDAIRILNRLARSNLVRDEIWRAREDRLRKLKNSLTGAEALYQTVALRLKQKEQGLL